MSFFYHSGFFDDGYQDAIKGLIAAPPDIFVYACEYIDGYNRAKKTLAEISNEMKKLKELP